MNDSNPSETPPKREPRPRAARPASRPGSSFRLFYLVSLVTIGLMFVADIPNEIVRWKHAAAIVTREAGDKERGYEELAAAYWGSEKHPDYVKQLMGWYLEDRKFEECLALLNQAIDAQGPRWEQLEFRANLYLHLRRFTKALEDCLEVERMSQASGKPSRAQALNGLAYARAVSKLNLPAAEQEIELSVAAARGEVEKWQRAVEQNRWWNWWFWHERRARLWDAKKSLASCLDSRGFILWQRDRQVEAKNDLDEALALLARLPRRDRPTEFRRYRDYLAVKEEYDHTFAVLYYHRGLILQKLGDERGAQRDFAVVKALTGKEPDVTLF